MVVALAVHSLPARAIVPSTWSAVASSNAGQVAIGNSESVNGEIAGSARYVVFESFANNLVPGVSGRQIYRKDFTTGVTALVSANSSGTAGNNISRDPSVSSNGRYVAFYSIADNLVAGDTNVLADVFVKDMVDGTIERASTDAGGGQVLDSGSFFPSVSNNGNFVAFTSWSAALVVDDTNKKGDVFVKDLASGAIERASTDSADGQGNGPAPTNARYPSISGDGRHVVFESGFDNLVPNDTNGTGDVFWKDTFTGEVRLVSAAADGTIGDLESRRPRIARNGRYVSFTSQASNLVPGDVPGTLDVFLKDTQTGAIVWISTDSAGVGGNDTTTHPEESAPSNFGREVVFASRATNLVPGDGNGKVDVFLKDVLTGATKRISEAVGGGDANDWSVGPSINTAGSRVGFQSPATNLVNPATLPGVPQIYRANN
jgi:Tol biopolymer transport system component